MVKIQQPITPSWQRAAARAAEDRKAGRVAERIACRTYRVPSATGATAHTVTITSLVNLQATCDCPAGQRGIPCRHAAAALCEAARHIAQCERERPSAPAPAPTVGPDGHRLGVAYNIHRPEPGSKMARFCRE